jgi:hypothetical protein
VDEKGAHPDHFGCRGHPAQRINDQCPAKAQALARKVYAKAGEDHHWLVVAARSLCEPLWGGCGRD